jgi:hypothetical protein
MVAKGGTPRVPQLTLMQCVTTASAKGTIRRTVGEKGEARRVKGQTKRNELL